MTTSVTLWKTNKTRNKTCLRCAVPCFWRGSSTMISALNIASCSFSCMHEQQMVPHLFPQPAQQLFAKVMPLMKPNTVLLAHTGTLCSIRDELCNGKIFQVPAGTSAGLCSDYTSNWCCTNVMQWRTHCYIILWLTVHNEHSESAAKIEPKKLPAKNYF